MMKMRRIGITERVDAIAERSERRDSLDQAWIPLLEGLGFLPVVLSNCLSDPAAYAAEMGIDGLVLSGGNDIAGGAAALDVALERDDTEHKLLRWAADRRTPVLGVCRGFQMMNVHLGGTLVAISGHTGTTHCIRVVRSGGSVPGYVNSFHNWAVAADTLAPDLVALSVAEDGTVEFARHGTLPWVGIMWHPERPISEPQFHRALIRDVLCGQHQVAQQV